MTKSQPGTPFYPAEERHRDLLARSPNDPFIAIDDIPKVEALKRMHAGVYRADPVLVSGPTRSN